MILYGGGSDRTAVEGTNLALFADKPDRLDAECIRSFPTVTFQGSLLLRREEIESGNTKGCSLIAALRHGNKSGKIGKVAAPFDVMYGFRGSKYDVDLFSAFEMLRHWTMTEIKTPSATCKLSKWTEAGKKLKELKLKCPIYNPGEHYEAVDGEDRILLPELPQLHGLRHYWMWTRSCRPHVPVWNYSRVPKSTLSPNENARLLNVYMRPWTLNPADVSEDNVLLSEMAQIPNTPHTNATTAKDVVPKKQYMSHAASWNWYIRGQVVSETSKVYITNLLGLSAARVVQKEVESSDDDEGP